MLRSNEEAITYRDAGVDARREADAVRRAIQRLNGTLVGKGAFGAVRVENGFFASVLDFGGRGLAISTDGVGTKVMVAQALSNYRTIGIDCVAVNANDLICVGATPMALVDYVAVNLIDEQFMDELMEGLAAGAEMAGISIPGGETAQLPDLLKALPGEIAFDLVGTCVGSVELDSVITGAGVREGDVVLGLLSSGVHSNGLTLARHVLGSHYGYEAYVEELQCTLGEELLKPTRIYVDAVLALLGKGIGVRGLAHITGDGLENLARLHTSLGFVIDHLPEAPAIFKLIQRLGRLSDEEMFATFNMGVGFCVVVGAEDAEEAAAVAGGQGVRTVRIGHATGDPRRQGRVTIVNPKGDVVLGAKQPK